MKGLRPRRVTRPRDYILTERIPFRPLRPWREQSKWDMALIRLFRQSHRTFQRAFLPVARSGLRLFNESNRCGSRS